MAQRVLVTAGAGGIGREIVRAFAADGARVFTCDIDEAGLAALAAEIPGLGVIRCDVAVRAEVEAMMAAGLEHLGGLDVLVNNAGIGGPTAAVADLDPDDWDRVMAVNLTSAFLVTKLAIPALKASGSASVINMSSAAGRFGYPNRSPYSVSKWGLIGFTKTLSLELGAFGIRANAILPGAVGGERMERVLEGRAQVSGRPIEDIRKEVRHIVDPKDVAALAVYLASDAAKSISGQALPIDGDMQQA